MLCVLTWTTWDANFLSELADGDSQDTSEDKDVTDESTLQPPVPVIKRFKEAMKSLEDVQHFFAKSRTYGGSFNWYSVHLLRG